MHNNVGTDFPILAHSSTSTSIREPSPLDEHVSLKRKRNNVAAKKYRQKKIDRIVELEEEVRCVKEEKDELKLELARKEAEVKMLREMLDRKS
jgi:hypothetical protein